MLQDCLDCLGIAHDSVTLVHSHEPSFLGLAILVELVEAHFELLARFKQELQDKVVEVSFMTVTEPEAVPSSPTPNESSRRSAPPERSSPRTEKEQGRRRAMTYPVSSSSRADFDQRQGLARVRAIAVKNEWVEANRTVIRETIKRGREYIVDAKSDARALALFKTDIGRGLEEHELKLEELAVRFENWMKVQETKQYEVGGQ